jgi:hypothetical protein
VKIFTLESPAHEHIRSRFNGTASENLFIAFNNSTLLAEVFMAKPPGRVGVERDENEEEKLAKETRRAAQSKH